MHRSPLQRFLSRFFPSGRTDEAVRHGSPRGEDAAAHGGFRTRQGDGPFLLSCDGRVIPLRKARFLRQR